MSQLHLPLLTPPSPKQEQPETVDRRVFWRNFRIIAVGHVVLLLALFLAGMLRPKPKPDQVLWLDGGPLGGGERVAPAEEMEQPDPTPEEEPEMKNVEPEVPAPTPPPEEKIAPSEIVEPKPTPVPATPKPATPKPATPKPATPKPATPKPATPTPATPNPKETKATPKPSTSPKPAASSKPKATPEGKAKASPSPEKPKGQTGEGKAGTKEGKAGAKDGKPGDPGGSGSGKGTGKTGSGSGGISQFGWYLESLHDFYYSRWDQPVGIGQDVIATVKLRILKDGTIAKHDLVKSSGNPQMDESVMSAVQKVEKIEPLPAGLGNGEYFDLNVNFKVGG